MDRTLLFRVTILLALLALASCSAAEDPIDVQLHDSPTWTGLITEGPLADVPDPPGTLFWIAIDPPGSGLVVGAILRDDSEVVVHTVSGFRPGQSQGLAPGQSVRLWSTGVEHLSTPPMVEVERIEVW